MRTPGSFSTKLLIASAHASQFMPSTSKTVVFIQLSVRPASFGTGLELKLHLGGNSKVKRFGRRGAWSAKVKTGKAQNEQMFSGLPRKRTSDLRVVEYRYTPSPLPS